MNVQRMFVRGLANSLKNPMTPEKPLSWAYQNYFKLQDKFWQTGKYTHNIRGKNYYPFYVVAPFFCAFFMPNLFLQKRMGHD